MNQKNLAYKLSLGRRNRAARRSFFKVEYQIFLHHIILATMPSKAKRKEKSFTEKLSKTPDSGSNIGQCLLSVLLVGLNLVVRAYCGLYMIISDCDETFNYWEPLNLVFRGFGKQTWEYSPEYAIRSYAYLIPYYIITFPLRDFVHLTKIQLAPETYFFYIRILALCGFTALTEYKLFQSTKRSFGHHTANWFLLFTTVSTGMSHAGVALLPSSFAMNWVTLGIANSLDALDWTNTLDSVWPSVYSIACFLVAGLVGWPFALALGAPFGIFTLMFRYQTPPLVRIVAYCSIFLSLLMGGLIWVDSFFYGRKMLFVPVNIVLYNVFSGEGEGPDIFGVEPLSYYVKNLFLNFNVIFIAGYIGIVLNLFSTKNRLKVLVGVSAPLLVWTVVFFPQPHKEERFLYPIYPLIVLSASIFTSQTFARVKALTGAKWLVRFALMSSMALVTAVSLLRILNLVENYSAPLTTSTIFYKQLEIDGSEEIQNVCVGREWYHFPTSFFLPDNYRLRFVASGFDGLLPGDFPENVSLQEAASLYPKGMNSKNIFSPEKLIEFEKCHYFIDNTSPVNLEIGEKQIVSKGDTGFHVDSAWEVLDCQKMINPSGAHRGFGRFVYIPKALRQFAPYDVEYMDYCILRKK